MSENILLQEAIKYTERGWYVFPCREKEGEMYYDKELEENVIPPIKSPYTNGGFKEATLDTAKINKWWKQYPEAGIGISCGPSNLVVADIDVRNDKKGFDNFMSMNISDEGALHSMTPSGGLHIIWSGNIRSNANIKAGVDIRSRGAYIVAPPSWVYEDGQKKQYMKLDDWDRELVPYPSSLEEKLNELRGKFSNTNKKTKASVPNEPIQKTIERLKIALKQLPSHMCEDYFEWINIGLALKTIGDDGFELWDEWSRGSSKYNRKALEYRWKKFEPENITIASIFHYAKMEQVGKNGESKYRK